MSHDCSIPVIAEGVYPFDARCVAKRFRHAAIFGALEALHPGETMRFCNDHEPLAFAVTDQWSFWPTRQHCLCLAHAGRNRYRFQGDELI